jgi:ElaB/YqjD/DUF883 family membrane-anchored ribosome-binding protein
VKQTPPDVTKDRLLDEFHAVVAETEQLLKSVASMSSETAGVLKTNVHDVISSAIEQVETIRGQSVARANAAAAATREYVRDNPWQAIGIVAAVAACAGLLAGMLIGRRANVEPPR